MSFQISNLHNKRMRAPIHQSRLLPSNSGLRNIQLRHNNRMIRRPAHRPIPPLGRRESRTMKDEFPSLGIPGRTTLQSFDIGAVAEFRLGITSNSLPGTDFGKPVFSLLGVALLSDSGFEHLRMHHTEKRKSVLFTYLREREKEKEKVHLLRTHIITQITRNIPILLIPTQAIRPATQCLRPRQSQLITFRTRQIRLFDLAEQDMVFQEG